MPPGDLATRLNEIHAHLITGSRTASRDLFLAALQPIKTHLRKTYKSLNSDEAHDLATDAILAHLNAPSRFDSSRASLWTYLCMVAGRDALDLLRTRTRQQALLQASSEDVELWGSGPNDREVVDNVIDARRIIKTHGHRLATNEPERQILGLLLEGEKSTDVYATALGLDPRQSTTVGLVKQAKDRLLLRIRRLHDEL